MDTDNKQSFEIDGVGKIAIRRRRGQKTTTLRISRRGEIVLGTNYSTPLYMLKKFALQNRSWLDEVRSKSGFKDEIEIFDGQILSVGLKFRVVEGVFSEGARYKFSYTKGSGEILIKTPAWCDSVLLDEVERAELDKVVIKALRGKAKESLPLKIKVIAEEMGADYRSVTVRNTSSRWGSCSALNDINLSLWLMVLPGELVDYVIIHELAHTRFKHHGKDFWDEVAIWCPNHRLLRAKLKKHSAQVWW